MPKRIPPSETHNKAAIYRGKYAALVAVPRKMNTAAVHNNVVDAIFLKKTEFDQIEAAEAALWLSIARAQQDGSDSRQLQKRHKGVVKMVNGITRYFDNYTDPTNDPTALAADASATTSTAIVQVQAQRAAAALGHTATAPPPTELDHITTNGDSQTASTTASNAAIAADASATTSTAIGQAQRAAAALGHTATAPPPTELDHIPLSEP
jgi:hypothetical protein